MPGATTRPITLQDGVQVEQLPLFVLPAPGRGKRDAFTPPPLAPFPGELLADSSLALALAWFQREMVRLEYAPNTRRNYLKGVARFVRFQGRSCALRDVRSEDLLRFEAWLRAQPRAEKTKELTLTAVRAFFRALVGAKVLSANPAEGIYPARAHSPLPAVLYDAEVEALRRTAAGLATRAADPDPAPALLLTLFLDLGLRLGEVRALEVTDVDVSNPLRPVVHVHYEEKRHRAKQRSLVGPPDLTALLRFYLERHTPAGPALFPWSGRRIQQIIETLGADAGVRRRVTPNVLRWTYALGQWKAGLPEETVRARLGLSKLGWEDAKRKLQALARRPV